MAVLTDVGVRLFVFAFLQTMHYCVWVFFFPSYAPDAARAFEARAPWLTGSRAWAPGGAVGLALVVVFLRDYASGKAVYSAFASAAPSPSSTASITRTEAVPVDQAVGAR